MSHGTNWWQCLILCFVPMVLTACGTHNGIRHIETTYVEGLQWEEPIEEEIKLRRLALQSAVADTPVSDATVQLVRQRYGCEEQVAKEFATAQREWYLTLIAMAEGSTSTGKAARWEETLDQLADTHVEARRADEMDRQFVYAYYELLRDTVAGDKALHNQ